MTITKTNMTATVADVSQGTVQAVFSTFSTVDRDGDVVLPGAMPADGTNVVLSAFGHTSWTGSLPIGYGVIRSTPTEAIVDATFLMENQSAAEAFRIVAALGARGLQEFSYSLDRVTAKRGKFDGVDARIISKIGFIKEVSPVLLGASMGTRVLSSKRATRSEVDAAEIQSIYDRWSAASERDLRHEVERARRMLAGVFS